MAFDTVASIAQQADVPPSTLIRFANAFGFSGFNEMKQMFKQHLMEETANYTERARLFRQTTSDESSPPENADGNPQYVHDGEQPGVAAAGDADLQR
ncbi:Predicted transcriptional regulator of the myo-inositol catabolic operon [Klebsiella pneumoniae ISC21]|nr:Predicted transcriptional regulator of the myo-inositol catabolic operon [Klebsiella pneumoniae ISC21]